MPFIIQHQTQPCPVSCVATCIAMITDFPANQVIEAFHKEYREGDLSIGDMFRRIGLAFKSFDTAERQSLDEDGVYMVSVPSLNIRGGMHQVIVEIADGEWTVLDPNMGRDDRLYYSSQPNSDLHPQVVMLGSGYNVDCIIKHEVLAYWRADNPNAFRPDEPGYTD